MLNEPLPADLIGLVTPQHVRGYALAKGWQRVPGVNGNIALFNHPDAKWDQLIVPMDTRFDDYARRIAEVIGNLAAVEQRGATEILNDLLLPDSDGHVQGETTLLVVHEEEMVKAGADLNPDNYQKAVDAHRTMGVVKFKGVLHLGRRIHRIANVTDFSVVQS